MPIERYFKGSGLKVYRSMLRKYGKKKGRQVFYATANKLGWAKPGRGLGRLARV